MGEKPKTILEWCIFDVFVNWSHSSLHISRVRKQIQAAQRPRRQSAQSAIIDVEREDSAELRTASAGNTFSSSIYIIIKHLFINFLVISNMIDDCQET